jgi:hypothetical protein
MQGKNSNPRKGLRVVLPLCLLGGTGVVHAMPGSGAGNVGAQERPDVPGLGQPASDASLDHVRGGFDVGSGLVASFGLQEETYINGLLVTSTSINIPDIGKITQQQAAALASALGGLNLVQNGSGNSVAPDKTSATTSSGSSVQPSATTSSGSSAQSSASSSPVTQAATAMAATGSGTSNVSVDTSVPNQNSAANSAVSAPPGALGVPSLGTGDPASAVQSTLNAAAASALSQGGALAQVVQNTLNNQSIQTLTTINVSLNTLQVLRQMNLQSTLQSAQLLSFGH